MSEKKLRRKLNTQKLIGVFLIVGSILVALYLLAGDSLQDSNATGLLITVPLGVAALFSKKLFIL